MHYKHLPPLHPINKHSKTHRLRSTQKFALKHGS